MSIIKKIEGGREYRDLQLDAVGDEKIVEGYATTFDEPYHLYYFENNKGEQKEVLEQVDRNAFKDADLSDVIFQYDHEGRVFARLSNGTMELTEDDHGLKVWADLGGTEIGRGLYEEIKGGYTNKMSFGFTVADDDMKSIEGGNYLRTIRKVGKLFDVSAVSYPQNNFTEISARKHCDGVIAEIEAERLLAEKEAEERKAQREALAQRLSDIRGGKHGN